MTSAPAPSHLAKSSSTLLSQQQQLDFLTCLFRPLLRPEEAAFLLDDPSLDHITHLVDEGMIRAVNVAVSTGTRRWLRIYRHSVERLIIPSLAKLQVEPSIEAILPHNRPQLLRREVAQLLGCTEEHVGNLALSGPAYCIRKSQPRQTFKRLQRIDRTALIEFLTQREVQA